MKSRIEPMRRLLESVEPSNKGEDRRTQNE